MLATGDQRRSIVLLERKDSMGGTRRRRRDPARSGDASRDPTRRGDPYGSEFIEDDPDVRPPPASTTETPPFYAFWTQFQSHEPEFDYLKSMEIEEKINSIRWCRPANGSQRLIATNDKMIKLWRVFEKDIKEVLTLTPDGVVQGQLLTGWTPPPPHTKGSANSPWGFGKCMPPSIQQYLDTHCTTKRETFPPSPPLARPPVKPVVRPSFQELRAKYKGADVSGLSIPTVATRGSLISAAPRRVFSNSHAYHINSVSLSSDEETFLSADDLRINVWNLRIGDGKGLNTVDIKPDSMDELAEVITCAEFHPLECHLFMHASSLGVVKLCDLRQNALCDNWSKAFAEKQARSARATFFSEIVASVSDVKFSPDGRYILARDYMNLKLWDINMEREPLLVVPVHEHLRPRMSELYEHDAIFDKFQCAFSHDGGSLLTGSYKSLFHTYSSFDGMGVAVEASVDFASGLSHLGHLYSDFGFRSASSSISAAHMYDRQRRVTKLDSAINEPIVAVGVGPALYIYYVPT